jgi:hypothetical protein
MKKPWLWSKKLRKEPVLKSEDIWLVVVVVFAIAWTTAFGVGLFG